MGGGQTVKAATNYEIVELQDGATFDYVKSLVINNPNYLDTASPAYDANLEVEIRNRLEQLFKVNGPVCLVYSYLDVSGTDILLAYSMTTTNNIGFAGGPSSMWNIGPFDAKKYYLKINATNEQQSNDTTDSSTTKEKKESTSFHAHSFSWQTIREATKDSDGLAQYRCSCGAVEGEQVISKTATTYTGLQKALKNAQAGEHVVYDSGEMFTLSDIMLEQLSQKKDVSAAIDFKYKNKEYTLTIPAGMDYTKFFADKEFFYGFLYFAQETDATVVEK